MSVGSHFRAPLSVKMLDGTVIEIVDATGALTGAVLPTTIGADTTFSTSKKAIFRSSGIYINSPSAGKLQIVADGGGADDITLSGGVTVSGTVAITGAVSLTGALAVTGLITASVGIQPIAVAITATLDGTGTGTLADGTSHATITSSVNTKIVILPTPTPGRRITLFVGANGYQLRSNSPATVAINGGTGSGVGTTLGANTLAVLHCVSATAWVGFTISSVGALAAITPAA